jgi:CO/xanthine dehydrogenase FAD-binding subunit
VKAAPFDYVRADSLPHALAVLAEHGADAKLLAGGMSLVPMMAMRLARPALLIDIYRLDELKTLHYRADVVVTGAAVRQRTLEDDPRLRTQLPLVAQALRWVGHSQTRNRGTVGGSLVHADPSAELALAALVLGATLRLSSHSEGERKVAVADFFLGPMFTATGEAECLTAIEWPVWESRGTGSAFEEISIRHGDFAMASAAAQVQLDHRGAVKRASFGVGGADGVPLAFPELAQKLLGQRITDALAREISVAAGRTCNPGGDMHASADYRRHLATVLVERVLLQSAQSATASLEGVRE